MSEPLESLTNKIITDYPRLSKSDSFCFDCHDRLECFTRCCADVNIALTPYDVLRLKRRLGISSQDFIESYVLLSPHAVNQMLATAYLRMSQDEAKRCPFVSDKGCTVYEDRPWACRMYPIGIASGCTTDSQEQTDFYFVLRDRICHGLNEAKTQTVAEWMENQKTGDHDAANEEFKAVSLHRFLRKGYALEPQHRQMFFMACYNLDRFREFVFGSSFLQKFDVEPDLVEALRTDDEQLLRFAFRWIRFALFHERTVTPNPDYEKAKRVVLCAE